MPTWDQVQAVAHLQRNKIVLRFWNKNKRNECVYFYHAINAGAPILNKKKEENDYLVLQTDAGAEIFRRLRSSNTGPYQYVLPRPWGTFKPKKADDLWIEYQYLPDKYWLSLPAIKTPTQGTVDNRELDKDKQALWRTNRSPSEPPVSPPPIGFTTRGWVIEQPLPRVPATTNTSTNPEITEVPTDLGSTEDLISPAAAEALNRPINPTFCFYDPDTEDHLPSRPTPPARSTAPVGSPANRLLPPPSARSTSTIASQLPEPPRPQEHHQAPPGAGATGLPESDNHTAHRPTSLLGLQRHRPSDRNPSMAQQQSLTEELMEELRDLGFDPASSQHPIQQGAQQGTTSDPDQQADHLALQAELLDERIRTLGELDASLNNLRLAILRNTRKLSAGAPPIIPRGTSVQSPDPDEVLDDELLAEINNIFYDAAVASSKALIRAQLIVFQRKEKARADLLQGWNPTPTQANVAARIALNRSKREVAYTAAPIPGGIRVFCRNGLAFGPNPEADALHSTGQRTPGRRSRTPPWTREELDWKNPTSENHQDGRNRHNRERNDRYRNDYHHSSRHGEDWFRQREHDDRGRAPRSRSHSRDTSRRGPRSGNRDHQDPPHRRQRRASPNNQPSRDAPRRGQGPGSGGHQDSPHRRHRTPPKNYRGN